MIHEKENTRKNARAPKRAKPGGKRPRLGDEEKKMKIVEQIEQLSEHESEPDVEICTRKTEQMSDAESKKELNLFKETQT